MGPASQPNSYVLGFLDPWDPGTWAPILSQLPLFWDSLISILQNVGPASQTIPSALGFLDFRSPGIVALPLSQIPPVLGFLDFCCFGISGFPDSRNMDHASQLIPPVFEFLDFLTPATWALPLNQFPLFWDSWISGLWEHEPCLSANFLLFWASWRNMGSASPPIQFYLGFLDFHTPGLGLCLSANSFCFGITNARNMGPARQPIPFVWRFLDSQTPGK